MKKKYEEDEEKMFEDKYGIKDRSKDCNMETYIKNYERDMRRLDRKILKMAEMDKKGVEYDEAEVEITESEQEQEEPRPKGADKYEDDPYKAEADEESNMQ